MGKHEPKTVIKRLEALKQTIRDLRDADEHVCPMAEEDNRIYGGGELDEDGDYPCTCEKYDHVNDEIDRIIEVISNLSLKMLAIFEKDSQKDLRHDRK